VIRATALLVAIALGAVATGCGEKRHTASGGGGSGSSAAAISETEFKLNPSSPSVAPGGTVTVKNDGGTTHALEIETPSGEVKTKPIAPGQSATIKAPAKAGSYTMYCPIDHHKQKGMTGKLKVGSGASSNGGGGGNSGGGGGGGY
jgi:plastocyanin